MLLLAATDAAAASITDRLDDARRVATGGVEGVTGHWSGVLVDVHAVGVGRAAAAFTLGRLLADPPRAVILLGTSAAYPDTDLSADATVVATADTYVDLGQEHGDGVRDIASLGVRIAPGAPGQTFLSDPRLVDALSPNADRAGPYHTAEASTTRPETAATLVRRWGPALTQSREGAAVAHACLLESVPMAHLRAMRGRIGEHGPNPDPEGPVARGTLDAVAASLPAIATALAHPFS